MSFRYQWLNSLSATDFPGDAYLALYQRLPQATPFNHLSWLRAAEQAAEQGSVHILLIWQEQTLCGCLPLLYQREKQKGLTVRVIHHLGYPMTDRLGLMLDLPASAGPALLQEIRHQLPHTLLQLHELTEAEAPFMASWQPQCSYTEQRLICHAPEHLITEADRQEVSGDVRYKLRRARKRCQQLGAEIKRLTPDATSAPAILAAITAVEQVSWKGDEGVGVFCGASRQPWMTAAFTAMASAGLVRVVWLEHQGQCISYRIGVLDKGRLYDYNLAFHPDHAALGSGRLLLEEWIRWGLDEGWQWIDASRVSLTSNHQLHERMTGATSHWRWSFYNRTASGLLLATAYRCWLRYKSYRQQKAAQTTQQEPSQ